MSSKRISVGKSVLENPPNGVVGKYVKIDGESFYQIANFDKMKPFFMSLVSQGDHWLFISSTGGLSAGRKDEDNALFPYYTDDKITQSASNTGSKSIFLVKKDNNESLWEPFSDTYEGLYRIERNIYKNETGNKLIFEEINESLGLRFTYSWMFSETFGFIKKAELQNISEDEVDVNILDGIQNILPYGLNSNLQNIRSNLSNAYKKNELASEKGLGLFMLSAIIVDKAEPSEALKTTRVFTLGLESTSYLLCSNQLADFRKSGEITGEVDIKAESGAFFVNSKIELKPNKAKTWYFAAEINQDYTDIVAILERLGNPEDLVKSIEQDISLGTQELRMKVGMADGLQKSNDLLSTGRHYSNVLFNIMRGGIIEDQYQIDKNDLLDYFSTVNKKLVAVSTEFIKKLPENLSYNQLLSAARANGNLDLIRISMEYLPLTFSRRHGDPSRPWNRFSIEMKKEDGSKNRNYQGNWRDIFQNWEALAYSFPEYIESMIAKFVNASTIDGYNPYRITRKGIDWEVIEPDDPWSYIGYWGDHQIIYLLKLLEHAKAHYPELLIRLLGERTFVFANVPYRIKSYKDSVANPKDTILFDSAQEHQIVELEKELGSDGKLIWKDDKDLLRGSLLEKLLITLLTKLYNFIPEAGIWLNTQRPEWNDANNALVGNGVSMVTLYYLRKFADFMESLLKDTTEEQIETNEPLALLLRGISACFEEYKPLLSSSFTNKQRREIVDKLGQLGETYRNSVYSRNYGSSQQVSKQEVLHLLQNVQAFINHSIDKNKREDGLYHSYNLISFTESGIEINYLYEMLEGQVAALTSGYFNAEQTLQILDALKASKIYRADQYSYMLYPNRELPRFLDKNIIPESFITKSELAKTLIANKNLALLRQDSRGKCHFNGNIHNANNLKEILNDLSQIPELSSQVKAENQSFLDVFELMFDHKSFTGRSGTFFGYEGLGSIYWHMVSKLLLATQEAIKSANNSNTDKETMGRLIDHYYEIRAGIGINKSPDIYGAFPTDPYSHTPANRGVQQPGMTGQVKEDILNRWAELGVEVKNGRIFFKPSFLNRQEFLETTEQLNFIDVLGKNQNLELKPKQLAFTYCQVPVVYELGTKSSLVYHTSDGEIHTIEATCLPKDVSESIFSRNGGVKLIHLILV